MIRAALIGLGNIGLLFDENPALPTARSHAKALWKNKNTIELKYAVDPDPARRERLKLLFPDAQTFASIEALAEKNDFDLLTIAVPTQFHFACASAFFSHANLKTVVLEKPAFASDEEYKNVPEEFRKKIVMNYLRRFPPALRTLREELIQGKHGRVLSARALYSKGIQNNGSHMIDLLNFFFGAPAFSNLEVLGSVPDHVAGDPTLDLRLELSTSTGKVPVQLQAGDERAYSVFELELFCERARISLPEFCRRLEVQVTVADPVSPGYQSLGPVQAMETRLPEAMAFLYETLAAGGPNPAPFSAELWNRALISAILAKGKEKALL